MSGEKILVVDDRRENLLFLANDVLRPEGYEVITAIDGKQALDKAMAERPDLIITDLKLPRLSGLELMAALRKEQVDIPVILTTFYGSEQAAIQAFRLGVRDYLVKPFETEQILEVIEKALIESRLHRERDQLMGRLEQINQQLERRVKELNILYSVGKSGTSLLDLEKVLNRIVEAAVFVSGAEEGSLLLVDKDTGELYLRAARNLGAVRRPARRETPAGAGRSSVGRVPASAVPARPGHSGGRPAAEARPALFPAPRSRRRRRSRWRPR